MVNRRGLNKMNATQLRSDLKNLGFRLKVIKSKTSGNCFFSYISLVNGTDNTSVMTPEAYVAANWSALNAYLSHNKTAIIELQQRSK
jgi:hypothetical protein